MQLSCHNGRSKIIKGALLLSLCFLLFLFTSCAIKEMISETPDSPEGIWTYPGGSAGEMSMVFYPGGKLVFVGGFNNFNPATWRYDEKTKKLQIKISNYDKRDTDCSSYAGAEYSCLNYNRKTDAFECNLTPKTKSLGFLGWNFLRK